MNLSKQHCKPCKGDEDPLPPAEISKYQQQVPEWEVFERDGVPQLEREFSLDDFMAAVEKIEKIAEIAEAEQHHPNLYLHSYNQLRVTIYTHKIKGLHPNDFILASKIDQLFNH